jgi:replicative DNA helicase
MTEPLFNIEVEQALLGAIFAQPSCLEEVAGFLDAEHFGEPIHAQIYATIRRLAHEGRAYTPITMAPFFKDAPKVGELTVVQYFGRLLAGVTSLQQTKEYGQVVKDFAERRDVGAIGLRLKQLAADHTISVSQAAAEGVQDLDTIIAASRPNQLSWMTAEATAQKLLHDLDNDLVAKPIPTGYKDLDRVIGGWRRCETDVFAARPSMGKSALGASVPLHPARAGHGTLIFSLEMTKAMVAARLLSDLVWNRDAPLEYADILRGRVRDPYDKDRLREATRKLAGLPIVIEDQPGLTIAEIAARSRKHAAKFERSGKSLDIVIIDHFGKVRPSSRYAGNLVNETGEISQGLAALAKDLNVAMIVLHQLNRAVEGREDKRPQLSDLRNSGDVEQDADTVGFLYRPAYYLERSKFDKDDLEQTRKETLDKRRHDLEVIIAKNRNGPICTVDLFVDIASNVIRNKARALPSAAWRTNHTQISPRKLSCDIAASSRPTS